MGTLLSRHAQEEMRRRQIDDDWLNAVLASPEQRISQGPGKEIWQSRFVAEDGRMFLLRVVLAIDRNPMVAVTLYRTSKIEKYWRAE